MSKLTFIVPFSEKSFNAAFLQAFGQMAEYMHARNVELLIVETGTDDAKQRATTIDQLMTFIDGIIIPGNPYSIDPKLYGQEPLNPKRIDPNPNNYQFLERLINKAKNRGIPTLGICAGSWVINVAGKGSLLQKIPALHDSDPRNGSVVHPVKIAKNSRLFDVINKEEIRVNSWHDQAVKTVADGMQAVATSPDGTIEGIEGLHEPFLFGLQFHAEYLQPSDTNEPNFLTATEIEQQTNIFKIMSNVGQQYNAKKNLNQSIVSTLTDKTLLEKQRAFTLEFLTRNFQPGNEHKWQQLVQNVIDRLRAEEMLRVLDAQIKIISNKANELKGRRCNLAHEAALTLKDALEGVKTTFNKNDPDYRLLERETKQAINLARVELEKHRGWKEILANIALCILGLGVGYLAVCAYRGSFFKLDTASGDILNQSQKSIDDAAPQKINTM